MKKILLTGSNGFIGNYFQDNYTDKYNIKTFSFRNDDFESLHVDDIDVVIHLSALVHQIGELSKEKYEEINVTQTVNLAKKAKASGVNHFIFMSTVKVYGEESDIAYKNNSICKPQDDYGKSKLKAEQGLKNLQNDNFKISIIRTPIVYGYGVKGNMKKIVNLVKNTSILPLGKIKNRRSMVYVGNLCNIIDILIVKERRGLFLASDDEVVSTTFLIEQISKTLNKSIYLIKVPFFTNILKLVKPTFYKRLYGNLEIDNRETKKNLDFKNPYTTKEGIELMIKGKK